MEQRIGSDQCVRGNFIPSLVSKKRPKIEIDRVLISLLALGLGLLAPIALLRFIALASASEAFDPIPARIVVNTLEDEESINGSCSLREAITAANINYSVDKCPAGSLVTDTITFDVAGTISLTAQLPYIVDAGPLVIDGGTMITITTDRRGRAMWVNPDARLILQNLTIDKSGEWNYYEDTSGGGIYNSDGIVRIDGCVFSENSTTNEGGAIYSSGIITITRSIFEDNGAPGGGAISNSGSLYIWDSAFNDNYAGMFGYGGAIRNGGILEVSRSTFYQNGSENAGSGISNNGWMRVINSTFSDNWAWGGGETACVSGNYRYGGTIFNSGTGEVEHSTFRGGVKQVPGGTQNGMSICNLGGELTIQNSILTSEPPITNCLGTITDGGYNIDSQDTCGFDPASGSLINTDPMLGPLQYNGGPTWTHAPESGSPAIDAANPQTCPTSDQRGVPRPFDGDGDGDERCDIGAYEVVPPGVPRSTETSIFSIQPVPSLVNKPIIVSFKVTSGFGIPTGTVTVTVADHAGDCTGTLTDGLGSCSFMLTEPGTYTLTASYGGEGDYLPSAGTRVHEINIFGAFLPLVLEDHPPAIKIVSSGIRPDRLGAYEMIGHVMNVSVIPVYSIRLTAILYDETGHLYGVYTGMTALPATFPDQIMPFAFEVGDISPNSYELIPHWVYQSPVDYRPVTVLSQEIDGACPNLTITGEIRNDQENEMKAIKVIVEPGGVDEFYSIASLGTESLLPDEMTQYTHTLNFLTPPCPTDFSVQGQGYLAP